MNTITDDQGNVYDLVIYTTDEEDADGYWHTEEHGFVLIPRPTNQIAVKAPDAFDPTKLENSGSKMLACQMDHHKNCPWPDVPCGCSCHKTTKEDI